MNSQNISILLCIHIINILIKVKNELKKGCAPQSFLFVSFFASCLPECASVAHSSANQIIFVCTKTLKFQQTYSCIASNLYMCFFWQQPKLLHPYGLFQLTRSCYHYWVSKIAWLIMRLAAIFNKHCAWNNDSMLSVKFGKGYGFKGNF